MVLKQVDLSLVWRGDLEPHVNVGGVDFGGLLAVFEGEVQAVHVAVGARQGDEGRGEGGVDGEGGGIGFGVDFEPGGIGVGGHGGPGHVERIGVIGGAGSVLTFLPVLLIFFAIMALLEDVGYMARAAFVMDRIMHLVGLHGKSFIPMCLGFGCNVPAVLGARIIETRKARMITLLLIPFVPCTARLAVLTLVSAAIFRENAVYVSWSILALNILVLGIAGVFVNKTLWKQDAPFIMELPLYHIPNARTIGLLVWQRSLSFVRKAGTGILPLPNTERLC